MCANEAQTKPDKTESGWDTGELKTVSGKCVLAEQQLYLVEYVYESMT